MVPTVTPQALSRLLQMEANLNQVSARARLAASLCSGQIGPFQSIKNASPGASLTGAKLRG